MYEYGSLIGENKNEVEGISFDRPTLHSEFPNLIFDLLKIKNTCFFGTDTEFFHSRYDMRKHCPDYMQENLKVINNPTKDWPFK